jgi:hypothetical protein
VSPVCSHLTSSVPSCLSEDTVPYQFQPVLPLQRHPDPQTEQRNQ